MANGFLSEFAYLAPIVTLLFTAVVVLLVDLILKQRSWETTAFCAVGCLAALVGLGYVSFVLPGRGTIFDGALYVDAFGQFLAALIVCSTLATFLIMLRSLREEGIKKIADVSVLVLLASSGAVVLVQAADLLTLFISLEVMSLACYALAGSALRSQSSSEAALKYFLLGSLGTVFILFGCAFLYGISGTTQLQGIASQIALANSNAVYLSLGFILAGLFFKLGLVPFHYWVPDVYQGSPATFTVFFSTVVKAAAAGLAVRFLYSVFGEVRDLWLGVVWISVVLSVSIPTLIALRQRSIKRILAFSAVAHAGYLVIGLLGATEEGLGLEAMLYYLTAYLLAGLGAWSVLVAVTSSLNNNSEELDCFSNFQGLGRTQPCLAAFFSLFLLSLAGVPPGFAGLLAKVLVFKAAISAGFVSLAVIAVVFAVVACNYYLRIIVVMYFHEVDSKNSSDLNVPLLQMVLIGFCGIGVVLLGLFPARPLELLEMIIGRM